MVDNNEKQESEGSGKELGRRGMVILNLDLLFFESESLLILLFVWFQIGTERIGVDAVVDNIGALGLNLDLDSTGPSVFDALFSSFSMILVTEVCVLCFRIHWNWYQA